MVEIKPDPVQPGTPSSASPHPTIAGSSNSPETHDLAGPPSTSVAAGRRLAIGDTSGIDSEALTQSSITNPADLAAPPVADGNAFQSAPAGMGAAIAGTERDAAAADLPVDPSAVWQSPSSRRTSQLALVVMLAVFGLVAATVGFIQFARSFTRNGAVAQSGSAPVAPSIVEPVAATDSDTQIPDPAQPDTAPPETTSPDAVAPAAPATESETPAAEPATPEPAVTEPSTEPGVPDSTPTEPVVEPVVGPAITAPPVTAEGAGMDDLPMGLRKFVPLLDISTAENGAPQIFATPPTIDSVQLDAAAELETEETPSVKRASIDIAKSLTMRFAIDNRGATLSELVLLVSQLTGVPIELEVISIDLAGISVNQPLQTPAGWMPIGQWLEQSLASAGLAMEIGDGVVLVHASVEQLTNASDKALVLDDFGDDAERIATWLKPVVTPLVGPAGDDAASDEIPDAKADAAGEEKPTLPWTYDAAEKKLVVPADRYLLVQSICAAEAMRLMRGKPTKLPRKQTARWIGRWTSEKRPNRESDLITDWPMVIDGPAGTQLDSPRTVAGLLRRVATENRAAVAVVWQDAMRHQVYPTDLAMPLSDGLTVGAYLDELIGEAGLQARDTGDSVWWIGSEGLYDRYEVITWMSIPPGSGDVIAKRLAMTLGVADPAQLPLTWDESTLMVRAPRYIARQLQRFITL